MIKSGVAVAIHARLAGRKIRTLTRQPLGAYRGMLDEQFGVPAEG
jgi:hypothetical protein